MNEAKIMQLFQNLSLTEDPRKYRDLIDAAMRKVREELRPGADENDSRLYHYAAACANLRFRRMIAAGNVTPTFAGTSADGRHASDPCAIAEQIMCSCRADAAPLLRDDAFVFLRTGGMRCD
ncbi:MAG: hypothetical protein MJ065_08960 [Oscillospiraceae bacterium]|nr:hypothetical protein [Oscillospiraceae bacterium]